MGAKLDRTGEEKLNNFGSKMIIKEYRTAKNIDVYFPEYNYIFKNATYANFKKGTIKCPYEPRIYNIGYLGEGKFSVMDSEKITDAYNKWFQMIRRCYDEKSLKRKKCYIDCEVCDEWLNFQNFAEWYYDNYYEIDNERMHLDKDILHKSKVYSPDNCLIVPERINTLFIRNENIRGDSPIGVEFKEQYGFYVALYTRGQKRLHLGCFDSKIEAFNSYKYSKENYIKQVADEYKSKIPQKLYNALYNYEVEITD